MPPKPRKLRRDSKLAALIRTEQRRAAARKSWQVRVEKYGVEFQRQLMYNALAVKAAKRAANPPPVGRVHKAQLHMRITDEQQAALTQLASLSHVSIAAIVRTAVDRFIADYHSHRSTGYTAAKQQQQTAHPSAADTTAPADPDGDQADGNQPWVDLFGV